MRAIHLYCDLVSSSVLDGLQAELAASGVDIGARAEVPVDDLPEVAEDELAAGAEPDAEDESCGDAAGGKRAGRRPRLSWARTGGPVISRTQGELPLRREPGGDREEG